MDKWVETNLLVYSWHFEHTFFMFSEVPGTRSCALEDVNFTVRGGKA